MKKISFLFTLLSLLTILVNAQKIGQAVNSISIDPTGAPYPLVGPNPSSDSSATQDTSKRTRAWLETGGGNFTTSPSTCYYFPIPSTTSTDPHPPFLFATNLYDTTKGLAKPSRLISSTGSIIYPSNVAFPKILTKSNLKITPNSFDIVPGDTMAFAVTYNIPKDNPVPQPKGDQKLVNKVYKLYFFYNADSTFVPVNSESQSNLMNAGSPKNCRWHSGEIISFNPTLPPTGINIYGHHDWICYTLLATTVNAERSVFFTMLPINDSLKIGTLGSVYAVLTENDQPIGTDFIQNMPFRPAHDPNYLIQEPGCLNFPKSEHPFEYTVHFQNTGAGRAKEVKVVVHLPKGMNWNSLGIKKATFAGIDYTSKIIVRTDQLNNQLIIFYKYDSINRTNYLLGTIDSKQPAVDPMTMGEILFSINSTSNTDDSLKSYADIYFRSEHPSTNVDAQGYEFPVKTNTGITTYKDCCNGNGCPPVPSACCKILGLSLWWWLIILLLLNFIIWYIISKRRRNKQS